MGCGMSGMRMWRRRTALAAGLTLALAPLARKPRAGAMGRVAPGSGQPVPDIVWQDRDGAEHRLSQLAGQGVVLNLWATWCGPCVEEMPSLDRLAASLAGSQVRVVALSSDRGGAPQVERFFQQHGIRDLAVAVDRSGASVRATGARGLPTTLLIDARGRERGRVEGATDWTAPETMRAVRALAGG